MNLKEEIDFLIYELNDCSSAIILAESFFENGLVPKEKEQAGMEKMIYFIEEYEVLSKKLEDALKKYLDSDEKVIELQYRRLYNQLVQPIH